MIGQRGEQSLRSERGLLIVGHGTREVGGAAEFLETVGQVSQRLPDVAVQPCFLEFATPTITEGAEQLARRGARDIVFLPLMLLAAAHVKRDIPAAVAAAAAELAPRYGPFRCRPTAHLGLQAELIALSAQRYRECIGKPAEDSHKPLAADQTLLLVVGRGARDALAADELRRFVQLQCQHTHVADARACFMALAEPSLEGILGQLPENNSWDRVVVQPHLLFQGRLLARLTQIVHREKLGSPDRQWLITRHLGPDRLLTDLIVRLVCESADLHPP